MAATRSTSASTPPAPAAPVRARALPRTLVEAGTQARLQARLRAAGHLDAAIEARSSGRAVAAHLGVDELVIRRLRHGDAPVSLERLYALPRSVARAALDAIARDLDAQLADFSERHRYCKKPPQHVGCPCAAKAPRKPKDEPQKKLVGV